MSNKIFGFPGGDWNEDDFYQAMDGLIDKGLAKKIGNQLFEITDLGRVVSLHMFTDVKLKS